MKTIITFLAGVLISATLSMQAQPWIQQGADIDGEAAYDRSGSSVSLSDDGLTMAIGASDNFGTIGSAGHVRVFQTGVVRDWNNFYDRLQTVIQRYDVLGILYARHLVAKKKHE